MKAILADDEPIIIRGLRKLIPWEELDIEIVAEAWTGRGLLELIEKHQPELVITDISMPDGSGIDVIKQMTKRQLRTKVIFISAYQEFSFAKDALANGAVDYLVKPIEKKLLMEAVSKAVTMLNEETEGSTYKSKLEAYERKDKKTQLEELFDRLTTGEIREEEAVRWLKELNADYDEEQFSVLLFDISSMEGAQPRWGESEKRLLLFALTNVSDEVIRQKYDGIVIRQAEGLCAIVNHPRGRCMRELACELIDKVRTYLKIAVTVGIGKPASSMGEIKLSYVTAWSALQLQYFIGNDKAIDWSESEAYESTGGVESSLHERRATIVQLLLAKERIKLADELSLLYEQIRILAMGSKEAAIATSFAFLGELIDDLAGFGIQIDEKERQAWLPALQHCIHYNELTSFLSERVNSILDQLRQAGGGKEAQQMKYVKDYIEEHYHENISLESIASMVYMNPYYFSSFFKKHTKQNFKQYVTEVRMKQAVRMLLQTDMMVYEIAERVGYNNARQFSDMFKKHYGKLPNEYKNQKK
jgi:two-component system, response regulator YesN